PPSRTGIDRRPGREEIAERRSDQRPSRAVRGARAGVTPTCMPRCRAPHPASRLPRLRYDVVGPTRARGRGSLPLRFAQTGSACGARRKSGRWSTGWRQSVAPHDVTDPREIGWPTRGLCEDGGNLSEVVGPENAGSDDAQRLGVNVAVVVEMVNRSTPDAQRLARRHVDRRPVDRPGGDAFEAVDRLFEAVVAVRRGHPAARPD